MTMLEPRVVESRNGRFSIVTIYRLVQSKVLKRVVDFLGAWSISRSTP